MLFEAKFLKVEYINISSDQYALKLLHISDIHIRLLKVSYRKIRKIIEQEMPDLIIMTGDYIDHIDEIDEFLEFLDNILKDEKVFMTFGNHDYKAFEKEEKALREFVEQMKSRNIIVLENKCISVKKGRKKYNLIGLSDFRYARSDCNEVIQNADDDAHCNIAFSHNPDIADKLKYQKIDVLLCGHFHGGQITFPFGLEFKLLRREKLGKMGYIKGLKNYNGIKVYLNRGIGNVCVPLRFKSRPEIAVIKI
jgi:hypothetical protein